MVSCGPWLGFLPLSSSGIADGIAIAGTAGVGLTTNTQIYNNTIYGNKTSGVAIHPDASGTMAARQQAHRWLVCDTSPLTTLLYCRDLFGRAESRLEQLAERSYDATMLCANDFEFVQDGTRRDATFRSRQHEWYVDALARRGVHCVPLGGTVDERVAVAVAALEPCELGSQNPCQDGTMKLEGFPFETIDWANVPAVEHPGESGTSWWRTVETGNVRVRMLEYSKGYQADHWCSRGHVILVLEGALTTELQDGRRFHHVAGQSYHVAEGAEAHRSTTDIGAKLFVVD